MKRYSIVPAFVERFPPQLEEGVLYISEPFSQAAHLCCCGCGTKIITSLKSAKWTLTKSGDRVSLWPSIGNSNASCKSHYVISDNEIEWCKAMTPALTIRARARDQADAVRTYVVRKNLYRRPRDGRRKSVAGFDAPCSSRGLSGWPHHLAWCGRTMLCRLGCGLPAMRQQLVERAVEVGRQAFQYDTQVRQGSCPSKQVNPVSNLDHGKGGRESRPCSPTPMAQAYQPRSIRFEPCRARYGRKPRAKQPRSSTVCGTRWAAKMSCFGLVRGRPARPPILEERFYLHPQGPASGMLECRLRIPICPHRFTRLDTY